MKLTNVTKGLLAATALTVASFANAGVVSTAYLDITGLKIEVDLNGDNVADQVDPALLAGLVTLSGTRSSNVSGSYFGLSASDNKGGDAAADVNPTLSCSGPDCAGLNDDFVRVNGVLNDMNKDYGLGDARVDGDARISASGYTYADAAISSPSSFATAGGNATITNNVNANLSLDVLGGSIKIRFVALYDIFVKSEIDALNGANSTIDKTGTNAGVNFLLSVGSVFGNINHADDLLSANEIDEQGKQFTSSWGTLASGTHSLFITQSSNANVKLVPEPTSLALFGLGILGLAGAARRRKS